MATWPAHLNLLDLITLTILGERSAKRINFKFGARHKIYDRLMYSSTHKVTQYNRTLQLCKSLAGQMSPTGCARSPEHIEAVSFPEFSVIYRLNGEDTNHFVRLTRKFASVPWRSHDSISFSLHIVSDILHLSLYTFPLVFVLFF